MTATRTPRTTRPPASHLEDGGFRMPGQQQGKNLRQQQARPPNAPQARRAGPQGAPRHHDRMQPPEPPVLRDRVHATLREDGPHTAAQLADRLAPGALASGQISKALRALEASGLAARTRQRPALWSTADSSTKRTR